jgi:16S rRNA (cytosine1402-N4)-methyltransferase
MVDSVMKYLMTGREGTYIDGTVGTGGHARAILERGGEKVRLIGMDRDPKAISEAAARLAGFGDRASLIQCNFKDIDGHAKIDDCEGILLDLGISSLQIADRERGFSYMEDGPLDMAMGGDGRSLGRLLATTDEKQLGGIIREYGEEKRSRAIAREIVRECSGGAIGGTSTLREIISRIVPSRELIPSLARVFQSLRIWVNEELDALEEILPKAVELLRSGGRLVIISYHSLEDRIVKNFFRKEEKGCICPPDFPECACGLSPTLRILTKRPVVPGAGEIEVNPRSRSARLRAAERL